MATGSSGVVNIGVSLRESEFARPGHQPDRAGVMRPGSFRHRLGLVSSYAPLATESSPWVDPVARLPRWAWTVPGRTCHSAPGYGASGHRPGLARRRWPNGPGCGLATLKALERNQRSRPHPHTLALLADALGLAPPDRAVLLDSTRERDRPLTPEQPVVGAARLPAWLTSFVGREAEVQTVCALLDPTDSTVRLLTLVGPGGVGKTRLAVAAAEAIGPAYADGVVFVDLAAVRDARLVSATIARAHGVREAGGRSAHELLLQYLRQRQALLVLDNFEHLVGAAPLVAELLQACPRVALLVTSRAALRLRAERRVTVEPLATPPDDLVSLDAVAASPAVRLFVERAKAVAPDLVLESSNAHDVAAVCRRLEGMPLAIELAAARSGVLYPAALLQRLERRLALLTDGAADVAERHQTLRATLGWSHDLLQPAAQVLFRRLAVFAGGWTLEAAEACLQRRGSPNRGHTRWATRAGGQQPGAAAGRSRRSTALRHAGNRARICARAARSPR